MKCPECAYNVRRGKEGMVCTCGRQFVLDPRETGCTDGEFLAAVRRASARGSNVFTEQQLFAEFVRERPPARSQNEAAAILLIPAGGLLFTAVMAGGWASLIFVAISVPFWWGVLAGFGVLPRKRGPIFAKALSVWRSHYGEVDGMLVVDQLTQPPPAAPEPDVHSFGPSRILVCDRRMIVDLLVLNRFHVEHSCVVIAEDGYPNYLLPRVQELLAAARPPTVYLVHDATPHGVGLGDRLRSSPLLDMAGADVFDLGLSPAAAERLPLPKEVHRRFAAREMPIDVIAYRRLAAMISFGFEQSLVPPPEPDAANQRSPRDAADHWWTATGDGRSGEWYGFEAFESDDGDGE